MTERALAGATITAAPAFGIAARLETMPARDLRDLMDRPWFSVATAPRLAPINYHRHGVRIHVETTSTLGIATIWDADVLISAASWILAAVRQGHATSRLLTVAPHELLAFIGRGAGASEHRRLYAALARLRATRVETTIRQAAPGVPARFRWLDDWHRRDNGAITLILPDWVYAGARDRSRMLTIDVRYFRLRGGIARALYRVMRKHGGRQRTGWRFTLPQLQEKCGSETSSAEFARELRRIAADQAIPGYWLELLDRDGEAQLRFTRRSVLPLHHPGYEPSLSSANAHRRWGGP
jgi:plasmid replication initiation protein